MSGILLDTHVFAWALAGDRLPSFMKSAIAEADAVYVSPISFYEIGQKVRIGKWPQWRLTLRTSARCSSGRAALSPL